MIKIMVWLSYFKLPSQTSNIIAAPSKSSTRSSQVWTQKDLLGWVGHLSTKESQRLETLANGMDVSHAHEQHFTVRVVF